MGVQLLIVALVLALPAAAHAESLPSVDIGHRPGPDVLYAPPPAAPQLENTGPWAAPPILVSGSSAYRDGEFLYQDFLYDDHGARSPTRDPTDPFSSEDFAFSPKYGTLTYPTGEVFANNAADLVELRVKPLADETAVRVTLNTLMDPEQEETAFTIALGSSAEPAEWPHGAGVSSPAELFLTIHGETAELLDAGSGEEVEPKPTASVDEARRQVDVRVPHEAWDPGTGTVRMAAGVGLWDADEGGYLTPQAVASAGRPGGAVPSENPPALFNMAFRFDEPLPKTANRVTNTIAEGSVLAGADGAFWREHDQALALADGDLSDDFFAEVDFGMLEDGTDDESGVLPTGAMNRILASRFSFGQGVDHDIDCSVNFSREFPCDGRFLGQLQPYAVYVPPEPQPERGFGLTLLLHGLSANHNNEPLSGDHAAQLGDRGAGSIVVAPLGRGPDGFYQDMAEADLFEVWADVARRYPLDPEWVASSGYSMGGIGTYRVLERWPDLFARGAPIVGYESDEEHLPSLRNIPLMPWNAGQDELVNPALYEPTTTQLTELGLRFVADVFSPAGHITLGANDEFGPQADFLGEHRVDREPAHVTYVVSPGRDSARALAVADHAYWLSGLSVRGEGHGTVDARSEAFGTGDPPVVKEQPSAGTLTGGQRPLAYTRRSQSWGPVPSTPRQNTLNLTLTRIDGATVSGERARLTGNEPLRVRLQSDGTGGLRLDVPLPDGATVERVEGPPVPGASAVTRAAAPEVTLDRGGASFRVAEGSRTYLISPPQATAGQGGSGQGGAGEDQPGGVGGGGGAGDDTRAADETAGNEGGEGGGSGSSGGLPFTGIAAGLMALLGLALALAGGRLRRLTRANVRNTPL